MLLLIINIYIYNITLINTVKGANMSEFGKFLMEQFGEHRPIEIQELVLDDLVQIREFNEDKKKALEEYSNLIHLSLNGLGLEKLNNLPHIQNLLCLSLNNNKLDGTDLIKVFEAFPSLEKLRLNNNKIQSMDVFQVLKSNMKMKKIETEGNPFMKEDNANEKLFDMLDYIVGVNKRKRNGEEIETTDYNGESDEEGEESEGEFSNELNSDEGSEAKESEEEVTNEDDEDDEDEEEEEIDEDEEEGDDDDDESDE